MATINIIPSQSLNKKS